VLTFAPAGPTAQRMDFAALRAREYARLDEQDCAYLDYTGAALYPESLVTQHTAFLRTSVLGNPHAENPASLASTRWIESARERLLNHLDADPTTYAVCFTSNATAAIGLVASAFRFSRKAPLVLSADNHNSVNGIREYARRAGAEVHVIGLDADLRLDRARERLTDVGRSAHEPGLFAYPAQSNFSGVRHPLALVGTAQASGFRVLLDAAALLPTSRISLRHTPADFLALSFYKMFGYPTGLGALVARRDALAELDRPWFAGGTVDFVSVHLMTHRMKPGEGAFEDGTADFLGIAAVTSGLDHMEHVGLEATEGHATTLAMTLVDVLGTLRHHDGNPVALIYGPTSRRERGATVAFNLLDPYGAVIPFALVLERSARARVSVRGGCFCNPGASEAAFGVTTELVGAVRASFGAPSNQRDVARLIAVCESFME
jgi:selenocysteine lyase/cysteine desulfurase